MKDYLKLIRIKHWLKNTLVFLPTVFGGKLLEPKIFFVALVGMVVFSLLSSAIYVHNDIQDIELDKKHPFKKKRPLPSGKISISNAKIIRNILLIFTIVLSFALYKSIKNIFSLIIPLIYLIINIMYSKGLKNIAIIDVLIIAIGFLLRVLYGSSITNIEMSNWLYLMILSGSFYLGFGKRRNEIIKNGNNSRKVLKSYSKEFLDKNMHNCLTFSIVSYSMWATDTSVINRIGNNYLIWTIPLIMVILMLYSLEIENDSYGDPVEVITNNKKILISIIIYCITTFSILYLL